MYIYRLNLYSLLLYMLQYSNLSIERQPWLKWTWIRYCLKVLMHKCVVRYSCLQQMRFTWFDFSSCKSFEVHFELVLLISLIFSKLRWFLRKNIKVPGFARICILDFFLNVWVQMLSDKCFTTWSGFRNFIFQNIFLVLGIRIDPTEIETAVLVFWAVHVYRQIWNMIWISRSLPWQPDFWHSLMILPEYFSDFLLGIMIYKNIYQISPRFPTWHHDLQNIYQIFPRFPTWLMVPHS